jgi:allantoicase
MSRIAHRQRCSVLVIPFDIAPGLRIAIGDGQLDRRGFGGGRDWIVVALMLPSPGV